MDLYIFCLNPTIDKLYNRTEPTRTSCESSCWNITDHFTNVDLTYPDVIKLCVKTCMHVETLICTFLLDNCVCPYLRYADYRMCLYMRVIICFNACQKKSFKKTHLFLSNSIWIWKKRLHLWSKHGLVWCSCLYFHDAVSHWIKAFMRRDKWRISEPR